MEGVDIHLDVNVGKQLSALGHTLTMLTSVQEDEAGNPSYDSDEADTVDNADASQVNIADCMFVMPSSLVCKEKNIFVSIGLLIEFWLLFTLCYFMMQDNFNVTRFFNHVTINISSKVFLKIIKYFYYF